jgi:HlyD family secretion protein
MKTSKIFRTASIVLLVITCSCSEKPALTLEGKVKRETLSIAPKLAGRIVKIYVHESDIVKKGDTLAIIDVPEVEAKMQQAEGAAMAAGWQYKMAVHGATKDQKEQVIAMFNAAKEQYSFAEKSLNRIRNMYNDSLVSPQAYDEAMAKFNVARAQYEAALAKKQEVVGGLRDEQVNMALGQKTQAEGAVREANTAYKERIIVAPKDMSIETIALHEGELALPGYNIFVGYEVNTTFFRFTASESKISKFRKDSIYTIELPYKDKLIVKSQLVAITELGRYAYKTTAYPNYEMGESVYELKLVPVDKRLANELFVNATAILNN